MVGQEVVILHAPGTAGQIVTWHFLDMLDYLDKPVPHSWRVLTIARCNHSLKRIDSRLPELSCLNGKMLGTMPERLFRPSSLPLRKGDVIEAGVMTVEILKTSYTCPTRVRFRFEKALESPDFLVPGMERWNPS